MATTDIKLNFINKSNDQNNSEFVIFQKNVDTSFSELAVAWLVIENCGQGWNHPFVYPMAMTVSSNDSWGNYSPQLTAYNGQQFTVVESTSGDILQYSGTASSANEVDLINGLTVGAIDANCYKDGRLLAAKTGIAPGQKAVFQFNPTIWIGAVSQVEQGAVMDSAILSQINTEISLFGIKSADLICTGSGRGSTATPFAFTLANIVYA